MAAGRVEIVVEGPNKVQVLLLYGGASIASSPYQVPACRTADSGRLCLYPAGNPHVTWWQEFSLIPVSGERLLQSNDVWSTFAANNTRVFR